MKNIWTAAQKKKAVLRALAGESTEKIASSLGTTSRTIQRWAMEMGTPLSQPAPVASSSPSEPSQNVVPTEKAQETPSDLERAKAAAGLDQADKTISATEIAAARSLRSTTSADYCVTTIEGFKGVVVGLSGLMLGMDLSDKKLMDSADLTDFTEMQVRANAEALEPYIRKWLGDEAGLVICGLALIADAAFTFWTVYRLAQDEADKRRAAREAKKKSQEQKAAA